MTKGSATLFISYRRDDSAGHVGRLYDALSARYGPSHIFVDIDHIDPGEDFVKALDTAISKCGVLLVVIGKQWADPNGLGQRLRDPNDFVRLEVAAGLQRDVQVIPVLVQGVSMPSAAQLPPDLHGLTQRNAFELSDTRWRDDVMRLTRHLDPILMGATATERPPMPKAMKWVLGVAGVLILLLGIRSVFRPFSPAYSNPNAEVPSGKPPETPDGYPSEARSFLKKAHKWRDDAKLVMIEVKRSSSSDAQKYSNTYSFVSPTDLEGLWAIHDPQSGDTFLPTNQPVRWPSGEIPEAFLDLPEAVAAAKRAGLFGTFEAASMQMYTTPARGSFPVWQINSRDGSNGPFYIDGITGAILRYQDIAQ